MFGGSIVRWLALSTAVLGIFLNWSTFPHVFDVEAWRQEQIAKAQDLLEEQQEAALAQQQQMTATPPSGQQASPATPVVATPTPPANGALAVDCDVSQRGVQTGCEYRSGATFSVQVHVTTTPIGGYYGFQAKLAWPDANVEYLPAASAASEALWPDCTLPVRTDNQPGEASVMVGCVPSPPLAQGSTFTGAVLQLQLQCQRDGVVRISLTGREGDAQSGTHLLDSGSNPLDAALAGASVTCGEAPPPSASPTATVEPAPTAEPDRPGAVIERDVALSGGTVASADGRVTLEFPAEAVAERLRVRITKRDLEDRAPIPGTTFVSMWEFEAFAIDRDLAKVEKFPSKLRLWTNYTLEDLYGLSPETLKLWTWNEEEGRWDELAGEPVPHTGVISAEIDHFSVFSGTANPAVFEPPFLNAYQTDLHTGASQVSLPIALPPGRGGLAPSLNLTYSSNLVNEMKDHMSQGSWVGTGWDLSAGSIRKAYIPGGGERYFLEMNGVSDELLKGSDNVWRTRRHDYLRIQEVGSCGIVSTGTTGVHWEPPASPPTPPCYWIVTDKEGTSYYFGGTYGGDGRSTRYYDLYWADPEGYQLFYYRWDIKLIADTHGNQVWFDYWQQPLDDYPADGIEPDPDGPQTWVYSQYLDKIRYNDDNVEVDFVLGNEPISALYGNVVIPLRPDSPRNLPDPDPSDPNDCNALQHIGGTGVRAAETRSLQKIVVFAHNGGWMADARTYEFAYTTTNFGRAPFPDCWPTAGVHKLEWVDVLGSEGGRLHRMTFSYEGKQVSLRNSSGTEPGFVFNRPFLTTAKNGFGGKAVYEYDLEAVPNVPQGELHWARRVVTKRRLEADTPGGSITHATQPMVTRYEYGDGPAHIDPGCVVIPPNELDDCPFPHHREEFRGFGYVKETHGPGAAPFTKHYFYTVGSHNTNVLTGLEWETEVWNASGSELWRQGVNIWGIRGIENCIYLNCNVNFIRLDEVDTYEGPVAALGQGQKITTKYEYDDGGNRVVERQLGWNFSGDERTIWRRHHLPPHPALPQFERVYQGDRDLASLEAGLGLPNDPPVSETTYFYDGHARFDIAPTQGELTGTHGAYGLTNVYYDYDGLGNKIAESIPTDLKITDRDAQTGTQSIPSGVPRTTWCFNAPPFCSGTHVVYPKLILNPKNHVTVLTWDETMGTNTQRTEPTGNVVHLEYDQHGRLAKAWDDETSASAPAVQHSYGGWEDGVTAGDGINLTITTQHGANPGETTRESHCFDGFGREIQSRRSYRATEDSTVQSGYDERGWTTYTTEPFGHALQPYGACSIVDPGSYPKTSFTAYTPLGHAEWTVHPNGSSTISKTDSNLTTKICSGTSALHKQEQQRDGLGRLTTVREFTGEGDCSTGYSQYAATTYFYDIRDNLIRVQDAQGNVAQMEYDLLSRKTKMRDPDMGEWTYEYDAAGNLKKQRDARLIWTLMKYDSLNRIENRCTFWLVVYDCAFDPDPNHLPITWHQFQYDDHDPGVGCAASGGDTGQLTRMSDLGSGLAGTAYWCYDVRGRVTKERRNINGATYDVGLTYKSDDQPASVTYPDSEQIYHVYDPTNGQPIGMQNSPSPVLIQGAGYDVAFRPQTVEMGNGKTTRYSYDTGGRVTGIRTHDTGAPNNGWVQDLAYDYNQFGNVWHATDTLPDPNEVITLNYDPLNRLDSASGPYSGDYESSTIGNLTKYAETGLSGAYQRYDPRSRSDAVRVVDSNSPPTLSTLVRSHSYDANGNIIGVADGATAPAVQQVDTDGDGCTNAAERGTNPAACGGRDPGNFADFADMPPRDCTISVGDQGTIVGRFGANDDNGSAAVNRNTDPLSSPGAGYHPAFDKAPASGADGRIAIGDIGAVVAQFGNSCGGSASATPTRYLFDAENRLAATIDPPSTAFPPPSCGTPGFTVTCYTYDGQGALVSKKVTQAATVLSETVYVGGLYEKELTTGEITKYYTFNGGRVAMRKGGVLSYLLGDHLGSTSTVLNDQGAKIGVQKYYPYGRARPLAPGDVIPTDKLFTGHQREGDLYFMQARFYDSLTGRFLSPDSIVPNPANPQSLNRYSYVYNNPLGYTDPTGHCADFDCFAEYAEWGCAMNPGLAGCPASDVAQALDTVGQSPGSNCPPQCEDINGTQYLQLEEDTIAAYDTLAEAGLDPAALLWSIGQAHILIAHEYPVDVSIYPDWLEDWYRAAAYAYVGHLISSAGGGNQIEGSAARLARGGLAPVLKGQAFEARASAALGLGKNTAPFKFGSSYVVPDFVDPRKRIFYEAKSGSVVYNTRQLRNYAALADQKGYALVVVMQRGSRPSSGLLAAQAAGNLDIRYIR